MVERAVRAQARRFLATTADETEAATVDFVAVGVKEGATGVRMAEDAAIAAVESGTPLRLSQSSPSDSLPMAKEATMATVTMATVTTASDLADLADLVVVVAVVVVVNAAVGVLVANAAVGVLVAAWEVREAHIPSKCKGRGNCGKRATYIRHSSASANSSSSRARA